MKLAIVGGHILTRQQAEVAWVLISGLIWHHGATEVVSGGATGVDSVVAGVASGFGYSSDGDPDRVLNVITPDVHEWDPPGVRGYKRRNEEIVATLSRPHDRLVRIGKHVGQRSYGSGWTADLAEERLGADAVLRFWI